MVEGEVMNQVNTTETQMEYLICKVCNGSFTSDTDLINHCKTHKITLDNICVICGQDFQREWNLINHMQIHRDVLREYYQIFLDKVNTMKKDTTHPCIKTEFSPLDCYDKDKMNLDNYTVKTKNKDVGIKLEMEIDCVDFETNLDESEMISVTSNVERIRKHDKKKKVKKLKKKRKGSNAREGYEESKEIAFKCQDCPYFANNRKDFAKHLNSNCKDKMTGSCDKCDFYSRMVGELAMHRLIHEPGELHQCQDCSFKTRDSSEYETHRRFHDEMVVFCHICNKTFKCVANRNQHMQRHSDERKFECNLCPSNFKEDKTYRRHMLGCHGIKINKRDKEPMLTVVDGGDVKFKCNYCEYKTKLRGSLKRHLMVHREKSFFCDICGKAFRHISHLKEHLRSHSQERIFQCFKCPQSYKDAKSLKRHFVKLHDAASALKCQHCSFMAESASYLKRHERKHSLENAYRCKQCSFSCRGTLTLKRHSLIHMGFPVYTCQHCEYKDVSERGLKLHLKRHREDGLTLTSHKSENVS